MGFLDNLIPIRGNPARTTRQTNQGTSRVDPFSYPTTMAEWSDRYNALQRAYLLEDYTADIRRALRLFEAVDDQTEQELIAQTRRLYNDLRFVVDRNAAGLFGSVASLEVARQASLSARASEQALDAGQQVWRRSRMTRQLPMLATNIAALGRMGIEVVRTRPTRPYRTTLALHWPQSYDVEYDRLTGTRITRVTIRQGHMVPGPPDLTTGEREPTLEVYQRVLTDTEIVVTRQVGTEQRVVEEESGPHGLGVVPFVNLVWQPFAEPGHGLSAAHGIEPALGMADSLLTMAKAAGVRFGDPKPTVTGATLGTDNAGHFGRWLYSSNEGTKFGYMEPSMAGINSILAMIKQVLGDMRNTFPSFAVFGGGANASGEALRMRQEAFEAKVGAARLNVLPGMAEAVAMAVAMDAGTEHDPDADLFTLRAGPIVPVNVKQELANLVTAREKGGLTGVDFIRGLQRLDIVPHQEDPAEYQEAIQAESAPVAGPDTEGAAEALEMARDLLADLEDSEEAQEAADLVGDALDDLRGTAEPTEEA